MVMWLPLNKNLSGIAALMMSKSADVEYHKRIARAFHFTVYNFHISLGEI